MKLVNRYLPAVFLTVMLSGLFGASTTHAWGWFGPQTAPTTTTGPKTYTITNPLPADDIPTAVGLVARIFTGICGSLALIMFVYGGFLWLTSAGNSEQVEKGKKIFTWSAIGLAIIFGAYAIVTQIYRTLGA